MHFFQSKIPFKGLYKRNFTRHAKMAMPDYNGNFKTFDRSMFIEDRELYFNISQHCLNCRKTRVYAGVQCKPKQLMFLVSLDNTKSFMSKMVFKNLKVNINISWTLNSKQYQAFLQLIRISPTSLISLRFKGHCCESLIS